MEEDKVIQIPESKVNTNIDPEEIKLWASLYGYSHMEEYKGGV